MQVYYSLFLYLIKFKCFFYITHTSYFFPVKYKLSKPFVIDRTRSVIKYRNIWTFFFFSIIISSAQISGIGSVSGNVSGELQIIKFPGTRRPPTPSILSAVISNWKSRKSTGSTGKPSALSITNYRRWQTTRYAAADSFGFFQITEKKNRPTNDTKTVARIASITTPTTVLLKKTKKTNKKVFIDRIRQKKQKNTQKNVKNAKKSNVHYFRKQLHETHRDELVSGAERRNREEFHPPIPRSSR